MEDFLKVDAPKLLVEDYKIGKQEEYLTEIKGDKKKKKELEIFD